MFSRNVHPNFFELHRSNAVMIPATLSYRLVSEASATEECSVSAAASCEHKRLLLLENTSSNRADFKLPGHLRRLAPVDIYLNGPKSGH